MIALLLGLAFTSDAMSRTKVSTEVKAGQTTLIYKYAVYLPTCGHVAYPKFSSRGAKNGTLSARNGSFIADDGQCKGKRLRSTDVYYTPKPGFRGTEKVRALFGFPKDPDTDWGTDYKSVTFTITVK